MSLISTVKGLFQVIELQLANSLGEETTGSDFARYRLQELLGV